MDHLRSPVSRSAATCGTQGTRSWWPLTTSPASLRRELAELMSFAEPRDRYRSVARLITASGAVALIEQMIDERLARALEWIDAHG